MKSNFNISLFVIILLVLQTFSLSAQEKEKGKLADFEEEVEKDSNSNNNKDDSNNDKNDDSHGSNGNDYSYGDENYEDDDYGNSFGEEIFLLTFRGIANLLFPSVEEIKSGYTKVGYSDYPYCINSDGIYDKQSQKKYSIYSNMSYFRESNTLSAFNFNARLSPLPAISVELNYSDFTEILKTRYDHLRMYDIFINYNRLKFENFSLWWGIGYKGLMGDRSHHGIGLNLGTNIFLPGIPVSLGINYNIGSFKSTNVSDFSPKIRFHRNRFEISIGYRRFVAGQVLISGWILGFGFYL